MTPLRRWTLLLAGICAGAGLLPAQRRILLVDAAGGGSYRTIQAAVDAARDGDVVRVKAGSYGAFTCSKGIAVLCDTGVGIHASPSRPIKITGLARGKDFTLAGGERSRALVVENCRGRVLLEGLTMKGFHPWTVIGISGSSDVVLHQVTVVGGPAVSCVASRVSIVECSLQGTPAAFPHAVVRAGNALELRNAQVECVGGSALGGDGYNFALVNLGPGAAVFFATDSTLELRGDRTTKLAAGAPGYFLHARSAIDGPKGSLRLDPRPVVTGTFGAPPIAKTIRVLRRPLPALTMTGAGPGAVIKGTVVSTAGDLIWVFQGIPADGIPLPAFGGIWRLDPRILLLVGQGTQGTSGRFPLQVPLPNLPGIFGVKFGWQALAFARARGLRLTNLASSVHF